MQFPIDCNSVFECNIKIKSEGIIFTVKNQTFRYLENI